MNEQIRKLKEDARKAMAAAQDPESLAQIRRDTLGKNGTLTREMRKLKSMAQEERSAFGAAVNTAKKELEEVFEERAKALEEKLLEARLASEAIDVTLPSTRIQAGHTHPVTQVMEEIQEIFIGMGYEVVEGPEVEYDYYNFEALNIPDDHPQREEQHPLYIDENILLRTQTTPVEIRVMERQRPPICAIASGRVFRAQEESRSDLPNFHQIEGIVIDRNITFSDLKGTMGAFAKHMWGDLARVRFRPYKYPYNEPSARVDVSCFRCGGAGCPVCGGEGWIEILGCGMIHPNVLSMSGIDPEVYSGFGFGLDVERITMLKMEIDDIRLLYENDESFLAQF